MTITTSHIVSIANETASLSVDLYGGGITDFHLHDGGINPFTFKLALEDMPQNNRSGASYQGHFICLGRWGPPTPGEIKAGIPNHGQAANMVWKQTGKKSSPLERGCAASAPAGVCYAPCNIQMQATTKLEGLKIERTIQLDNTNTVFKTDETITNINPLSRLHNIVQHPTIAQPFLTNNTIVNCNADTGFNYLLSTKPIEHSAAWPYGIMEDGDKINVSKPNKPYNSVFSYIVKKDAEFGWITAYTAKYNLLIGYLWHRETYPWISLWQDFKGDNIRYRGLEFGTTGMHKPYKQIIEEGNHEVFGERSYLMIDAGETQQKSYLCFMLRTPEGFNEVNDVNIMGDQISIKETNGNRINIKTTLAI